MSTDRDELDRLLQLRKRGEAAGFDKGSPEDRALMRAILDKIAGVYSRVVVDRVWPKTEDKSQ